MIVYRTVITSLDAIMMLLITLMKKDTATMSWISLAFIILFAMNIGLIWH